MQTDYKYITYREDKGLYAVRMMVAGEKVQKSFASLDEAISYRNAMLLKRSQGTALLETPITDVPTLREAIDIFIEHYYRNKVAPSTLYTFQTFRHKIERIIGKMKIDKVNYPLWKCVLTTMQEQGDTTAARIKSNVYRFRAMYDYFIERGIIVDNPLTKPLSFPAKRAEKKRAFTKEEKKRFLLEAKVKGYWWYFLFLLYFQTGCRRGELLALQWEDVDFINKRITIDKSIGRGDIDGRRVEYLGNTKTESSNRTIPISKKTSLILQLSYEKNKPCPGEFVFKPRSTAVYKWVSLSTVNRVFAEIRDKACLDRKLTLHCIRHTFATELIAAGVDIPTAQRLGGWSTPKTLLAVYAHSNDEAARKALERAIFCDVTTM